jgi:hypothetical protein
MRYLAIISGMALVLAGCGGGGGETAQDQAAEAMDTASETMESTGEAMTALAAQEGEVLLTGTMGCGHCNFHQGDSCAAAMKTTDGVVYIFDGIGAGHELFDDRKSEKPITVVGQAMDKDGQHFLTVRDYRM